MIRWITRVTIQNGVWYSVKRLESVGSGSHSASWPTVVIDQPSRPVYYILRAYLTLHATYAASHLDTVHIQNFWKLDDDGLPWNCFGGTTSSWCPKREIFTAHCRFSIIRLKLTCRRRSKAIETTEWGRDYSPDGLFLPTLTPWTTRIP